MNYLGGGYKIIGLVKKIRHLFNDVGLNNFSTLVYCIPHIHKNYNAYFWKFSCILFFRRWNYVHLGGINWIFVTLKTYYILDLSSQGIKKNTLKRMLK